MGIWKLGSSASTPLHAASEEGARDEEKAIALFPSPTALWTRCGHRCGARHPNLCLASLPAPLCCARLGWKAPSG